MPNSIHQEIALKATPAQVYQALTQGEKFAAATGAPADIGAQAGAAFSCFGGQIIGRQIELRQDRRIVQAWRAAPWPDGLYSLVHFELSPSGKQTRVTMDHAGFPAEMKPHLDGGWHKMYWEPLAKFFA